MQVARDLASLAAQADAALAVCDLLTLDGATAEQGAALLRQRLAAILSNLQTMGRALDALARRAGDESPPPLRVVQGGRR